jgi:hypothetical protein
MFDAGQNLPFGRGITGQLVGDDHAWHVLKSLEELAEKLLGSSLIAPALHEDIQHVPMLINSSPQIVPFAVDGEKHLIQMPLITTARAATTQLIGIPLTEFEALLSDCFVGQCNASLGHKLFDVTITEGETKIEPDTVTDDLGRKAIAFVVGSRDVCFHAPILSYCLASCTTRFLKLTIPDQRGFCVCRDSKYAVLTNATPRCAKVRCSTVTTIQ